MVLSSGWPASAVADPVWSDTFDGPANGEDGAAELVTNSEGDVYIAGRSDKSKNESDMFVLKYAADGTQEWTARVDSAEEGYDSAAGVARVPSGGVVIAGIMGGPFRADRSDWDENKKQASAGTDGSLESDWGVARIDADGSVAWKKRLAGPGGYDDAATSLYVADGSVYVHGMTADSQQQLALSVAKLDLSNGAEQWMYRADDHAFDPADDDRLGALSGFGLDANLLAPAPGGGLYATGTGVVADGQLDLLLVKLDEAGNQIWERTWDAGTDFDTGISMVTDDDGHAVVLGETLDGDDNLEMVMLKVTPDNELAWSRRIETISNFDTSDDDLPRFSAADLAIDGSNDLYATGIRERQSENSSDQDLLTVAVDGSSGAVRWEKTLDRGLLDEGTALEVAGEDNLYVAGGTGGLAGLGFVTANYDPKDGTEKWNRLWNNDGSGVGGAGTLAMMPDGGPVVSGALGQSGEALTFDLATVKYESSEPTNSTTNTALELAKGCAGCLGNAAGSSGGTGSSFILVFLGLLAARLRR